MSVAHFFFQLGNVLVLPAWIALVFFPGNAHVDKVVKITAVVLAATYTYLIVRGLGNFDTASFSTLQGLRALFASDAALAAGWLHYLCFDLLIGYQIVVKGREQALSRWKYTFPLPFTFMFGPLGWLIYVVIKAKTNIK